MKVFVKRTVGIGATILMATGALAACSSTPKSASTDKADHTISVADGTGKTLTVWSMVGDFTPETLGAINAEFTKQTGAKVKVETQAWDNIGTKLSTALSTSTPPDVLDLAPAAPYGHTGALTDLTPYTKALQQGQTWIPGLLEAGTIDGKLYGAPSFAASRVVIYNKTMWAAAGVSEPPTTYQELTAALDKLKAANSSASFSAFYTPGANWLQALPWIWDAGGDLYSMKDGKWVGETSTKESQEGLNNFKEFQNTYSSVASRTLYTDVPDYRQVFADGNTGAILANASSLAVILKDNPKLTMDDLGTFPFPGKSGNMQPSTLAGSQWGVAVKGSQQELALLWVKIAVSPEIQNKFVFGHDGWIPNSVEGVKAAESSGLSPQLKSYFEAATTMRVTPTAAKWGVIEDDDSLRNLFSSVVTGSATAKEAAATFDAHIASVLNGD